MRLTEFFNCVADGPLADELVSFIIENKLISIHFGAIESAGLYTLLRRKDIGENKTIIKKMTPIINLFEFYNFVVRYVEKNHESPSLAPTGQRLSRVVQMTMKVRCVPQHTANMPLHNGTKHAAKTTCIQKTI